MTTKEILEEQIKMTKQLIITNAKRENMIMVEEAANEFLRLEHELDKLVRNVNYLENNY